ncbi:MAG: hypothetical protein ACI8RN_002598 [Glaciecola sp.]|jgi:hypothetical protein|uniref:hypothetical protein n=1 Tax=Congregibacter sp. TaxID=2744308 RepID=UPI0039E2C4A5
MLEQVALVVHVMGWVFWLGTDLGVFIACRFAERGSLSVETRLTLLEVGMILDRLPRLCVPLVWGSGVVLSSQWGYEFIPVSYGLAIAAIWLIATWLIIFQVPGTRKHRLAMWVQTLFYGGVIVVGMGGGATWLLSTGELPLWLALKWYAYVIIAISALTLERYFVPVVLGFQSLASEGASDETNSQISKDLVPVYVAVLCIYAGTVLAGISGLLKPGM